MTSETSETSVAGKSSWFGGTRSLTLRHYYLYHFYLTTNQRSIASEICIDLTLTTKPDNLTEVYQLSGLLTTHSSRRTEASFMIRESQLPGCFALLARKTPYRSWIWDYGYNVGRLDDNDKPIKH